MRCMIFRYPVFMLFFACSIVVISVATMAGCAQIGMPTGGEKDTLAPRLIKAIPLENSLNIQGQKITLAFDEFVELQDVTNNLLISPYQKNNPSISYNLRTVTVKLKDNLIPNTTYHIQFGNAIKDINEGNVLNNFHYVFSTGNYIDSFSISGKVVQAESGKIDSTLWVFLYRNAPDTAISSRKPDYITRLDGKGQFRFAYLPAGSYQVYALKDGDGNKYYSSRSELFAFHTESVNPGPNNIPNVLLYAYAEKKPAPASNVPSKNESAKKGEKKLQYNNNLIGGRQDLLRSLELTFNNRLSSSQLNLIKLTDTNFISVANTIVSLDSPQRTLRIQQGWKPDERYCLIIPKEALADSVGNKLLKADTIRFQTKRTEDYGSLKLSFSQVDFSKHPVLQFFDGETLKGAYPITSATWKKEMMEPGEFEVRLLLDENNNGIWDPGQYERKIQPEHTLCYPEKLRIRANWENEKELSW